LGKNAANTISMQKVITAINISTPHVKYITRRTLTTLQKVNTIVEISPSIAKARTIP
jgi:hypothetical protein